MPELLKRVIPHWSGGVRTLISVSEKCRRFGNPQLKHHTGSVAAMMNPRLGTPEKLNGAQDRSEMETKPLKTT